MSTFTNPSKSQVQELTIDDLPDLDNILQKVASKSIAFGIQLKVKDHKMEEIEREHKKPSDQLRQVLRFRLRQLPKLTWHDIVKALESESVGMEDFASEIRSKYIHESRSCSPNSGCPPAKRVCPESLDRFVALLRKIYEQDVVETGTFKWPRNSSHCYIELICVDRTTEIPIAQAQECTRDMVCDGNFHGILQERVIDLSDIGKGDKKLILVEGAPGVGKSELAHEMCKRWSRKDFGQQYELILRFSLSDKRMGDVQTFANLMGLHPLGEEVEKVLLHTKGENIMIILEGYDELPNTCQKWPSVFSQLISGYLLPCATILVTSRPWAKHILLKECSSRIFQHIQILGFTDRQIEDYVVKVLKDKGKLAATNLISYIRAYPQIKACMYIPLNLAIVVNEYQERRVDERDMPRALTEMYSAVTCSLLLRYLYRHPEHSKRRWNIKSLMKDLPEDVHSKLLALSKVAYSGIYNSKKDYVQLIFSDEDVDELVQSGTCSIKARGVVLTHTKTPEFDTLGLMQSIPRLYVTRGEETFHNFLNLSIQEFLAALYISNMSPEKQMEHFHKQEKKFSVVLRFLAGLTKLLNFLQPALTELFQIKPQITQPDIDRFNKEADVVLSNQHVNWIFETQESDLVARLLQEKTVEFASSAELPLLDWQSLGYCILHSHSQWALTINTEEQVIKREQVQMLVNGAKLTKGTNASIVGLRSCKRTPLSISAEALDILFIKLNSMIHLQELCLDLPIDCGSITWPDFSKLQVLHLGISAKRNLRLDLLLPDLSIESLRIESTSDDGTVGLQDCKAISKLLASSKNLECLHFLENKLYNVTIDSDGIESITNALSENRSLRTLVIESECTFSSTAAYYLARFIQHSTTLHHLRIGGCTFSAQGLLEIAEAICNSSLLNRSMDYSIEVHNLTCTVDGDGEAQDYYKLSHENLYLRNFLYQVICSHIGDKGVQDIAKTLNDRFLHKLDLSNNDISDTSARELAKAFYDNSNLWELNLSNNSIGDTGSAALAQALCCNFMLKTLNLIGNDAISENGAHELIKALTYNTSIRQLYLPKRYEECVTLFSDYSELKSRIQFL